MEVSLLLLFVSQIARVGSENILISFIQKKLGVKIFLICIILCKTLCETVDDKTDGGKMFELF